MKIINRTLDKIDNINEKDFLKYSYIILSLILLLGLFIIYRYFANVNRLKNDIKRINNSRVEVQNILSRAEQINKQKEKVEELLRKNKNFKILQYFDSIAQSQGISNNIKSREVTTNDLENLIEKNYAEVRLTAIINDINTKQLVEILKEFEKNERIYTKNLEITKSNETPTIDVTIVIATIQPRAEISEITE